MYSVEEARDIPEETSDPTVVSVQTAVTEAATQVTHTMPEEELDALILALDVKTVKELKAAFQAGWRRCKEVEDVAAQKKLKSNYDAMLAAIESGSI
jgi:hypothetical protein